MGKSDLMLPKSVDRSTFSFEVRGQGQVNFTEVRDDFVWTCAQRAAEFHGATVGFDIERHGLGILDVDASEIREGFHCLPWHHPL